MKEQLQRGAQGIWDKLNSKAGMLILGALLASGVWKTALPMLGLAPAGQHESSTMGTPLACTQAMKDMADALKELKGTVAEEQKAIQDLNQSVATLNGQVQTMLVFRTTDRRIR